MDLQHTNDRDALDMAATNAKFARQLEAGNTASAGGVAQELIDAYANIGDNSNLILDPDLDSF